MATILRIQPLDRQVLVSPSGALSPEAAAQQVAAVARNRIAAAAASNAAVLGRETPHEDFVNGAPSQAYETVRPGQSIVAIFDLGSDLLQWIFDQLVAHSPVLTGAFRSAIAIYADGIAVPAPQDAASAAEVMFTDLVPYARKIERGASAKAPNGVFEAVAALAQARYGNQARIRFAFREPTGGSSALDAWARRGGATGSHLRRRQRYHRDTSQPAIVVTFR